MEIFPIVRALRRNKTGALLISIQIALTLAIVCNCLSIIQQRIRQMEEPTGIDEANIFTLSNAWVTEPDNLESLIGSDLAALRSLPSVIDAEAVNSLPLGGFGDSWGLSLMPDQKYPTAPTNLYFVDDRGLAALGLHLLAGRWFAADEVGKMQFPPSIVVTRALATALFPTGNGLGQVVHFTPSNSSRIVGIVERAQSPWASGNTSESAREYSTFLPRHFLNNGLYYVVRTQANQQIAVMRAAQEKLYALTRQRVIQNVQPFSKTRADAYRVERATSVMLGTVCAFLVTITVFGVVGLTMYWVTQRRRYIGIRRALGGRRVDILRYFHTENLLIAGTGGVTGIALGLACNAWLATHLELSRMSPGFICLGALIVIGLCQTAVLWPALRAASVSPALATGGL
jgi:putative ABC transport system permease protein